MDPPGASPSSSTVYSPSSLHSAGSPAPTAADAASQMKTFNAHLAVLADPTAKDEAKLKAAQELSDHFDLILASPHYQHFLGDAMRVFLRLLQDGAPHFIAEYNVQQVSKAVF